MVKCHEQGKEYGSATFVLVTGAHMSPRDFVCPYASALPVAYACAKATRLTKRITQADPHFCRATLMLISVSLLAGCAATIVPATQAIEVRLVAEDPAWSGPLECQASNPLGSWQFIAPGTVTVQYSDSPLQITCKAQSGTAAEASPAAPKARSTMQESAKKGYGTGAKVGAGVGVGLGVAAAPVLGPIAIMFVPFSAAKGGEIGGLVGAVTSGGRMEYPSPIEVYIRRVSPPD